MSYANVIRVVSIGVAAVGVFTAGYMAANRRSNQAREDLVKENEELRREARAFFETIKTSNANFQKALADIIANPPGTREDFVAKLRHHGVLELQITEILRTLDERGIYRSGAQ